MTANPIFFLVHVAIQYLYASDKRTISGRVEVNSWAHVKCDISAGSLSTQLLWFIKALQE